jgi:hypothetical protein
VPRRVAQSFRLSGQGSSIVVLDDTLPETRVFLIGDDALLAGTFEFGQLLANAAFILAVDLGAAEAAAEGGRKGNDENAGENETKIHGEDG